GSGDELFINTSGIGLVAEGVQLSANQARPGDIVLLSGSIGEHGICILAQREGLKFETTLESDSAALHTLVAAMLQVPGSIRCMRDPTRGGVSSALNEIAAQSRVGIALNETAIKVREEVQGACEMLGLDPLYVANEGKLIAIVEPAAAEPMLEAMRAHPLGNNAQIIGTVTDKHPGLVTIRSTLGTTRIVDMLAGDQLPRICRERSIEIRYPCRRVLSCWCGRPSKSPESCRVSASAHISTASPGSGNWPAASVTPQRESVSRCKVRR